MRDSRASEAPVKKVADMTMCELMDDIDSYGYKAHGSGLRSCEAWRILRRFAEISDDAIALAHGRAAATGAIPK